MTTPKDAVTMLVRKSPNHVAGILIGLLLAVQFPALVDSAREFVGSLGLGASGALLLAASIWMTSQKDKKQAGEVLEALMTPPPVKPAEPKP
jgi:hypothetical protein